jgi:RNA polymerase sigma-54 factor
MGLEMKQSQRMSQELRMTPQLQQAIRLLQLSRLELVDVISAEMVENPMLEEIPENGGWEPDPEPTREPIRGDSSAEEATARKAVEEIDWERYVENYSSPLPGPASGRNDELPGVDQTVTAFEGLTEHLLGQLIYMQCEGEERRLAESIIHNLDDAGYLRGMTLEELAASNGVTPDAMEDALTLVQELEPTGVGARTLSECLLLQAQAEYPYQDVLHDLIRHHLPDLEKRNYAGIARSLGVSKDDIMDMHRVLQTLNPRPGRQFSDDGNSYITPDIYIFRDDAGQWTTQLNDDGLPRLRVSDQYRRSLRGQGGSQAKEYVQERLRSAMWLIKSIEQRQRTIRRVTQSIIEYQQDFLEKGIEYLRPLVLRDIAEDIGMHESTISRVTTNKYVHTPQGIFELKYFFNSSIRKQGGEDVAAEAVKHHIKSLISAENAANPLSDQQLVEMLHKANGIQIARRTVAKYREMLGIMSSSKRRTLI